jgi:hypothetical protein
MPYNHAHFCKMWYSAPCHSGHVQFQRWWQYKSLESVPPKVVLHIKRPGTDQDEPNEFVLARTTGHLLDRQSATKRHPFTHVPAFRGWGWSCFWKSLCGGKAQRRKDTNHPNPKLSASVSPVFLARRMWWDDDDHVPCPKLARKKKCNLLVIVWKIYVTAPVQWKSHPWSIERLVDLRREVVFGTYGMGQQAVFWVDTIPSWHCANLRLILLHPLCISSQASEKLRDVT